MALKEEQTVSSATRAPPGHKWARSKHLTTTKNPWALETLDADEGPSEAQKQQERIGHARGLARCMASLQGFNRTPMPSSSRNGGIRAAMADVQDTAIAGGMGDLLLSSAESFQTHAALGTLKLAYASKLEEKGLNPTGLRTLALNPIGQ